METFDIFTARDLRNKSGELLKDAEAGQLSLITKHGKPAILAIPFDKLLVNYGVHRSMALHLFKSHQLTLAQSAKVADLDVESFIELLGQAGIAAVDYSPEELDDEMIATS